MIAACESKKVKKDNTLDLVTQPKLGLDQNIGILVKIEMACSDRKKRDRAMKFFVCYQWPKRSTKSSRDL